MNRRRARTVRRAFRPLHRFLLILSTLAVPVWAAAEPAVTPQARLAAVIAGMQAPAQTSSSGRQARAELAAIVADEPDGSSGLTARYLIGRMDQLEQGVAEPAELTQLIRDHPDHPLAQLAALKVLLHRLYADGPETADARLAHGEALASTFTLPALRCDYHLAMGEAYIFHGDRAAPALRHLRAAAALGVPSAAARANVLVQIGELARLTGDRVVAAASYRAFLGEFPRDLRQQIVRDHLAEVEGKTP